MQTGLRIAAVVLLLGSLVFWWGAGANRGWTRTSVPRKTVDEVTGIEGVTYEKKFVPGIELLGVAVAGAVIIAAASFLFPNKKHGKPAAT